MSPNPQTSTWYMILLICHFKGRKFLFAAMLVTMMLPAQVLMIPQYLWYQKLGWVGTYIPLIVPYFFAIQGFFVYLMINFIDGIPKELANAASADEITVPIVAMIEINREFLKKAAKLTFPNPFQPFA